MAFLVVFDTRKSEWNGHHFADDILRCIFLKEEFGIFIHISPNFVPRGPVVNKLALV